MFISKQIDNQVLTMDPNHTMELILELFEKITPTHMLFFNSILALYVAYVAVKNKK